MLKELKDDMVKVKKMVCEQNENINKQIENLKKEPKRNSGVKQCNNQNENFTKRIQKWI